MGAMCFGGCYMGLHAVQVSYTNPSHLISQLVKHSISSMAEGQFRSTHLTSKFDIPYLNLSSLNTLDLHFPTDPAPDSQESGLWLM